MHLFFNQQAFMIRCEWGACGVAHLVPESDAVVIVDVLSFSTCVDIAVGNGAIVYPYRWQDASAPAKAFPHQKSPGGDVAAWGKPSRAKARSKWWSTAKVFLWETPWTQHPQPK
jgi:hypothetical protein